MATTETTQTTMSFTTTKETLQHDLAAIDTGIRNHHLPLMRCVLLDTRDGHVRVAATGDGYAIAHLDPDATTVDQRGVVAVNHESLSKLLPALTKGMKAKDAKTAPVTVRTGEDGAVMVDMAGYTMPVETAPVDEYPELPQQPPTVATVTHVDFAREAARVLTAVAADDLVQALGDMCIAIQDQQVEFAGTDRYRLAVATVPATTTGAERKLLVPADLVKQMVKHGQHGRLVIGAWPDGDDDESTAAKLAREYVSLSTPNLTLITPTDMRGQYPTYETMFPKNPQVQVRVDQATLATAVDKAQSALKATGDKTPMGRLRVEPEGVVSVVPKADGSTAPGHPATVQGLGESGSWLFNLAYLKDAVATVDTSDVVLHLSETLDTGKQRPVVMTPADGGSYRHLLMPVQDN